MTNNTNQQQTAAPKSFSEAYTLAIGHIIRFEEVLTNSRLNTAFAMADAFKPQDGIWKTIKDDLAELETTDCLYGDYLSDSDYPWIRKPHHIGVVVRHATLLGENPEAINRFIARTKQAYDTQPSANLRLTA